MEFERGENYNQKFNLLFFDKFLRAYKRMIIETSQYFGYYNEKDEFITSQIDNMGSKMLASSREIYVQSTSDKPPTEKITPILWI